MVANELTSVGRYRLIEDIGAGGFATVYRALDPLLDRQIALKVLHPHLARDAATRERFVREGRALARIRHPNIVQVFDAGEADGRVYIAMELVEGRSLTDVLRERGRFSLAEVVQVTDQVAGALAAVHEHNLVHCDVKPANILLEHGDQRAVLLDLGVARTIDDSAATGNGSLLGTPAFMAPEQVEPGKRVSPQTDLYQLGATVFTILAGEPPFSGEPAQVIYSVVHREPPELADLQPGLGPGVSALIAQSLAKEPRDRPRGTVAFATRLHEIAGASGRLARPRFLGALRPAKETRTTLAPPPTAPSARATPLIAAPAVQEHHTEVMAPPPTPIADDVTVARVGQIPPRAPATPPPAVAARRPWLALALGGAAVLLVLTAGGWALRARGGGAGDGLATSSINRAGVPAVTVAAIVPSPASTVSPSPVAAPVAAVTPSARPASTPTAAPSTVPTPTPAAAQTPVPTPTATARPPTATATAAATAAPVSNGGASSGAIAQTIANYGFTPSSAVVSVAAAGGTLSVQRGDSSDGQLLFIFLNDRFLGFDWPETSANIIGVNAVGPNQFSATYADPNAPGAAVTVLYTLTSAGLKPDRVAPGHCLRGC